MSTDLLGTDGVTYSLNVDIEVDITEPVTALEEKVNKIHIAQVLYESCLASLAKSEVFISEGRYKVKGLIVLQNIGEDEVSQSNSD